MSPLSGKTKVIFAEFLADALTASELHRLGLRSDIHEDELHRQAGGNKVGQALGILRIVERLFEGPDELGMYAQIMRDAVNVYRAAERSESRYNDAAAALANEGVKLNLDQPSA